jgi:hypothetical protein
MYEFVSERELHSITQTSSTFLRALACCYGYTEAKAFLYLSRKASARVQQARDGVGMRFPIAHGSTAREGQTRIPSIPSTATLDFIQQPVSLFYNIYCAVYITQLHRQINHY